MKSNKLLNAIAIGLISTVGVGLITPITPAFAANKQTEITSSSETSDNNVANKKTNVKIIKNDSCNIEYTYDQNGKSYKVAESFTEDFSSGTSNIYEKNSKDDYDLISVIKTTSTEKDMTFKTLNVKTNKTKSETVKLENRVDDKIINSNLTTGLRSNSSELTDWQFSGYFYYNLKIMNWTAGAISALLLGYRQHFRQNPR
ncbi:hypothetical protein [Clostridium sp. C2-6-12]|uniref:hypothetical protein n=1 Tax=Clostridium sp. C2-6-12 TaxID=2698832 RepID=UPI00136D4B60|nr:hypothetical protein [Clostridium sp. C2-6-12]